MNVTNNYLWAEFRKIYSMDNNKKLFWIKILMRKQDNGGEMRFDCTL